jgi:hypothetical protein
MFSAKKSAAPAATGEPIAQAVDFDGTNDYLSRSSDLTGNADGKTFTFSAWVWPDTLDDSAIYVAGGLGNDSFQVAYSNAGSPGQFTLTATSTTSTVVLSLSTSPLVLRTFSHLLISVDLSGAGKRAVYINDVIQSVTWSVYANTAIDFTRTSHAVGSLYGSARTTKGRASNVYLDYTYRDLSVEANRRLFITADRKPTPQATLTALNPILYLPIDDPTTAHVNLGTGGDFALTGVVARSGRGPNQFNAPYSDLDGSADYLSRTTVPTGIADGKVFTLHACIAKSTASQTTQIFTVGKTSAIPPLNVQLNSSNNLEISGRNESGVSILSATLNLPFVIGRNYVLDISIDLADASKRFVYVNGENKTSSVTWTTYTNDNIDLTTTFYFIGAFRNSTSTIIGSYGKYGAVLFNTSYIDLSVASNLAKFVAGTGIDAKPVDLGADGSTPLGVQPLIYLPMYGNNAGKNYGSGGDFTVNSGPYTGARGPNEFWGNRADFDGVTGYLYKDTTLGMSDSKTFSMSMFLQPDAAGTGYTVFSATLSANSTQRVQCSRNSSNQLQLVFQDSVGTDIFGIVVTSPTVSTSSAHILISADMADSAKRAVYINGVAATVSYNSYTNQQIPFSTYVRWGFAATRTSSWAGGKLDGKLSEFYFTTDYIDFSQEANRLKFRDAFGNPVALTPQIESGALPNPAIYMRFDPASFGTNSGTGGDFTVSGTITDGGQL